MFTCSLSLSAQPAANHLLLNNSTIRSSAFPTSLPLFPFLLCLYFHLDVQEEGFWPPIFLTQARLNQTLFAALTNGSSATFQREYLHPTMEHFCLCHCCLVSLPSGSETTFAAKTQHARTQELLVVKSVQNHSNHGAWWLHLKDCLSNTLVSILHSKRS